MSRQHKTARRSHSAISDLTFRATAQPLGYRTKYRYDAFGNTLSSSGTLAAANAYRFSSKELHTASGFYIYLYRFYDPGSQRWINRDPLGEVGGLNLFSLVNNDPPIRVDTDGLGWYPIKWPGWPKPKPAPPKKPSSPPAPSGPVVLSNMFPASCMTHSWRPMGTNFAADGNYNWVFTPITFPTNLPGTNNPVLNPGTNNGGDTNIPILNF